MGYYEAYASDRDYPGYWPDEEDEEPPQDGHVRPNLRYITTRLTPATETIPDTGPMKRTKSHRRKTRRRKEM